MAWAARNLISTQVKTAERMVEAHDGVELDGELLEVRLRLRDGDAGARGLRRDERAGAGEGEGGDELLHFGDLRVFNGEATAARPAPARWREAALRAQRARAAARRAVRLPRRRGSVRVRLLQIFA